MKLLIRSLSLIILLASGTSLFIAYRPAETYDTLSFPWRKEGLTERQAAAHLVGRFSFGAKPGELDEIMKTGLEKWFAQQLDANLPDNEVTERLKEYESLGMSNAQIAQTFPKPAYILRRAVKAGVINKDSVGIAGKKEYRQQLLSYMSQNGMKPQQELFRQLINQKIIRAAYSRNQMKEVLTDFWFNHFNVSLTKGDSKPFVTAYERDVIRPHVLGKFEDMLKATAHSPAMLTYLDNFRSVAQNEKQGMGQNRLQKRMMRKLEEKQAKDSNMQQMDVVEKVKKAKKAQGLNENYAREIMELHTLGVDGGYTQSDVTQAARILTGWTFIPMDEDVQDAADKIMDRVGENQIKKRGFVREGDFFFNINKHDKGEKVVMGVRFDQGGGYEEGVKLIHLLATHPSTAKFISRKLAVKFVSDTPPQSLVDKMAAAFLKSGGDIKAVLATMVNAPEFWSKQALREKTKSPFELAISSVRSLNATVVAPYSLYNWMTKMGQQIYYYQAPTGFPDRGQYWINTGSLLNRMNFGLALASGRIPGVKVNLSALNHNREPESAEAALMVYTKMLLPERNAEETVRRLTPMLTAPDLQRKIDEAAGKNVVARQEMTDEDDEDEMEENREGTKGKGKGKKAMARNINTMQTEKGDHSMLAQVVGIIIGSPEFQRK